MAHNIEQIYDGNGELVKLDAHGLDIVRAQSNLAQALNNLEPHVAAGTAPSAEEIPHIITLLKEANSALIRAAMRL